MSATEQPDEVPRPKYRIGQLIYRPGFERSSELPPCPDCAGSKEWTITTPAGTTFKATCQTCGTYSSRLRRVPVCKPTVTPMVIRGIEAKSSPGYDNDRVRYYSEASCTGWVLSEVDVFTDEQKAWEFARLKAAEATAELQSKEAELMEKARVLNPLTIIDATVREAEMDARRARWDLRDLRAVIHGLTDKRPGGLTSEQAEAVVKHLLGDEE